MTQIKEQYIRFINTKQLFFLRNPELVKMMAKWSPQRQYNYFTDKKEGRKRRLNKFRKQKNRTIIAGRGFGKTNLIGIFIKELYMTLPRASWGFASLTYGQIHNNSMMEIRNALTMMGIHQYHPVTGGHYVIGKRPPTNFTPPILAPDDYDHVMTFHNGFTIIFMSSEAGKGGDVYRGLNLDGLILDEAGFIEEDWYSKVLQKTVRANAHRSFYTNNPLHHTICKFTSMPWTFEGQWVLKDKALAAKNPDTRFYMQGTCFDNKMAGEAYAAREKLTSTPEVYAVEIQNKQVFNRPDGFYPRFSDNNLQKYTYDYTKIKVGNEYVFTSKKHYKDYNPHLTLELNFDFNSYFTFCAISQLDKASNELRFIKEFFVYDKDLRALINDVMDYFAPTQRKQHIDIYGDRNGYGYAAGSKDNRFTTIKKAIKKYDKQYVVSIEALGQDIYHDDKHRVVNDAFARVDVNMPKVLFNQHTCKSMIISIRLTPMNRKFGKVHKNKGSESLTTVDPREAPHASDAVDYRVYPLFAKKTYTKQIKSGAPPVSIN